MAAYKHGAPSSDITIYINDVSRLFHSPSEQVYKQRLVECCQRWDAAFEEYYKKEIHPTVPDKVGRWVLEALSIYNPYSGVTNNQSEGLNRVMKDFQSWKEAPLDTLVLALYQLQAYYTNEVRRGFASLGQYHPTVNYESIKVDAQDVEYVPTRTPFRGLNTTGIIVFSQRNNQKKKKSSTQWYCCMDSKPLAGRFTSAVSNGKRSS